MTHSLNLRTVRKLSACNVRISMELPRWLAMSPSRVVHASKLNWLVMTIGELLSRVHSRPMCKPGYLVRGVVAAGDHA